MAKGNCGSCFSLVEPEFSKILIFIIIFVMKSRIWQEILDLQIYAPRKFELF